MGIVPYITAASHVLQSMTNFYGVSCSSKIISVFLRMYQLCNEECTMKQVAPSKRPTGRVGEAGSFYRHRRPFLRAELALGEHVTFRGNLGAVSQSERHVDPFSVRLPLQQMMC